ncbi:hypothetical protein R8Z57_05950 [Microbacterium sp. M3]|uniref:Lipoprotein n=1 Tax=Microbacterium arthrosphaerae TaxID=792652 RepID=A0ABU4GZ19_9MICO|nr:MULTISPECIES: hypothetical protein [Microbacterium]MDW4572321.1 hypothetical protein [Microbacterium arthrosphaerae]MDW7606176.1 hypothetical protein [Microbacterium sp. M3]
MRIGTATATTAIAAALVLAVAGCTQPPAPEPTPTPAFSSEDEAFAAAEATYRAYVDALNQVDLSDPATFEAVYDLTTGDLNASDRKSFTAWHADGYVKSGEATVVSIAPQSAQLSPGSSVVVTACLDISAVDIRDAGGLSVVGADRPAVQALEVALVEAEEAPSQLRIISLNPAEGQETC